MKSFFACFSLMLMLTASVGMTSVVAQGTTPTTSTIDAVSTATEDLAKDLPEGVYADFVTNHGEFIAKLFVKETPITTANFIGLAEGTKSYFVGNKEETGHFYDGLVFHRIIDGFMIQGGDPTGTGRGGPGYKFEDEIVDDLTFNKPGLLAMANAGPGTNGSQFFITVGLTSHLDGKHTIFGEVVRGMDKVDEISKVETDAKDRPKKSVVMESVRIFSINAEGVRTDGDPNAIKAETTENAAKVDSQAESDPVDADAAASADIVIE